jgi:hypothetical protein
VHDQGAAWDVITLGVRLAALREPENIRRGQPRCREEAGFRQPDAIGPMRTLIPTHRIRWADPAHGLR